MIKALFAILLFSYALAMHPADAASVRVSPTTIEVPTPGAASTLRLHNQSGKSTSVQVRVYRWTQNAGIDHLTETQTVVASPPIATLSPGKSQIVRIVRVSKAPVEGEESYRILVDEIPDRKEARGNAVTLAVRHSIPVFFGPGSPASNSLEWNIQKIGSSLVCVVHNRGMQRIRLAALQLKDTSGNLIAQREGLVGYVLGQSSMSLQITVHGKRRLGDSIEITALTENGPIRATSTILARD